MPIVDEIERRTGRSVAPAAVHVTLRRLQEKARRRDRLLDVLEQPGAELRAAVRNSGDAEPQSTAFATSVVVFGYRHKRLISRPASA